jgi:hypothetical protein
MTAKEWCEELVKSIKEDAYNCECQEGGVDAMSIDTDWLREASRQFAKSIETIERVREVVRGWNIDVEDSLRDETVSNWIPLLSAIKEILKALDGEQE